MRNALFEFAVMIIRLSAKLPNTPEGRVVRNQIAKVWNICWCKLQRGQQVS